ncbi:MAG: saccharopine dehydrogenase NADP-binding domain-containing protein [Elusimicrobia bacterium]|nr:saccharopine dehydrogenase NADP-binding domain-containing protein [Elusimicrobiota bacterium]
MARGLRYSVLGGAGAMGRITVRDLAETAGPRDEILVADCDLAKARAVAAVLRDRRVRAVRVDVRDRAAAARALAGTFALINDAQYQLNCAAMELALALRCHYVDLGGLFHVTRRQLGYHSRFRAAGRTALLGMGAAPGITNILARAAAEGLDTVREIHTRVGSMDDTRYEPAPALALSYSLKTILEEFSFRPVVFTKGRFVFVEPMSGDVPHRFPAPVGLRRPMYTLHSELATLVPSFRSRGLREASFKIAFDPEFTDRVLFLRDLGLAAHEPVEVPSADGRATVKVAPVDLVNKVAMSQPAGVQKGPLRQYEVIRAVVKGTARGRQVTRVADCHTAGMPAWGVGLDIDTGAPPSIAAQMLASGEILARGAVAPERAVPHEAFFRQLRRRGMRVRLSRRPGWSFPV